MHVSAEKIYRRGKLPEPSAHRYFQLLVSALRFCHQNGIAHHDVKPQNLLLDEDSNLKVSDFELSALPEQLKNGLVHTACGTPAYTGSGGYILREVRPAPLWGHPLRVSRRVPPVR
ncbi:hypothetical protein FH972_014599 [Carpinus fangiana]|uniref:Protein kinase domain-containing protein n=1 Tax=Carpinus fangiana TaxID=176857 RepID=A0A5N6RCY5_9ROSI|nr:hypothetical protein FH972_014599 [Carpinus fangiana]